MAYYCNMNLNQIEIILCDTQDGANIGSVCRAMKTMGLTHLTLVTDRIYDEDRVRTLALHAYDLYENRKEFLDLKDAVADSVLSVAATRRVGKGRKTSRVTPEELAERIANTPSTDGKVSIVFGCESNGLSDEQVRQCSMVVTIPTSDAFPSLNLSQAVQIIAYSLFHKLNAYSQAEGSNVVSLQRVYKATENCKNALEELGYFKNDEERAFTGEFLTDLLARAALTEGELKRVEKIFTKSSKIALHAVPKEAKDEK